MAQFVLLTGSQLSESFLKSFRDKNRVVAKTGSAGGLEGDVPRRAGLKRSDHPAPNSQSDTTDKPALAPRSRSAGHQAKQFIDVLFVVLLRASESSGVNPGTAA